MDIEGVPDTNQMAKCSDHHDSIDDQNNEMVREYLRACGLDPSHVSLSDVDPDSLTFLTDMAKVFCSVDQGAQSSHDLNCTLQEGGDDKVVSDSSNGNNLIVNKDLDNLNSNLFDSELIA